MIKATTTAGVPAPFVITAFTQNKCIQTVYALDGQCTMPDFSSSGFLNVSHLSYNNGHIRFLRSVVLENPYCCDASIDLTRLMRGPNNETSAFVLHGVSATVIKVPKYDKTPRSLDSTIFSVDGWPCAVPVTGGFPVLASPGWVKTGTALRAMFEMAYTRAIALGAGDNCKDVLAVLLQSAAGPYTKQLGGDWRGCGYSAKCTNQDCDGMAMNVLVFFTALRAEAKKWSFPGRSGLASTQSELLKYDTPVFITGESARPSDLKPSKELKNGRTVYVRPTKKWPIGHAWAGIAGPDNNFIHIECTTPGATTAKGGLDEAVYLSRIKQAGGIAEIDGSHGAVSAVGVRQHHPACYNPWAAYTPSAMYTAHKGVRDVCSDDAVAMAISAYYNKTFTRIGAATPVTGTIKYEHGAHRPNSSMKCAYTRPDGVYKETCGLIGESGIHAFSRFKCEQIAPDNHTHATD